MSVTIIGQALLSTLPREIRELAMSKGEELTEYCSVKLEVSNGLVSEITLAEERVAEKRLILPLLFNAHTHLGDSFIAQRPSQEELPRDIMALVAPPNGLKHRLLAEAGDDEIIQGISRSLQMAQDQGVSGLMDFRENGARGLELFARANLKFSQHLNLEHRPGSEPRSILPLVLGRPDPDKFDKKEVSTLLDHCAGINISSLADVEGEYALHLRERIIHYNDKQAKKEPLKKRKLFALHASERTREDVGEIIDLKPDFVVHCVQASEADLRRFADARIPVVVCPSSNLFFELSLDIQKMLDCGVSLALGTDNCMLRSPSMLEEMKCLLENFDVSHSQALAMALAFRDRFLGGGGNRENTGYLYPGSEEGFVVVEGAAKLNEYHEQKSRIQVF